MGSKLCCLCAQKEPQSGPDGLSFRVIEDLLDSYITREIEAPVTISEAILHTLEFVRNHLESEQGPPWSLQVLQRYAENESGWLSIMEEVVELIPDSDPLAPVAISVIVEETSVPSKESINEICQRLKLPELISEVAPEVKDKKKGRSKVTMKKRNICVLLSCLAEKMAGPSSICLMSHEVLDFLFHNIRTNSNLSVTLFSIIALEKFSLTGDNKLKIVERLKTDNVLEHLERFHGSTDDLLLREVGFCARWSLDNLFVLEGRVFSYTLIDHGGDPSINVILNHDDVSEYLKLSACGLEARCDATSFESARCTLPVSEGVWYYEVQIVTCGIMQVGWASKDSKFVNQEGFGVGDDEKSIAYDGCRRLIWHNAKSSEHKHPNWKRGDILGLLLSVEEKQVSFSLNGDFLPPTSSLFDKPSSGGYFAAASFMSHQQCIFNFGARPFVYPPPIGFKKLNDHGILKPEERTILPRHMKLATLKQMVISEDSCMLCADRTSCIKLLPCMHPGFCRECSQQLNNCPICRQKISRRLSVRRSSKEAPSPTPSLSNCNEGQAVTETADDGSRVDELIQ